MKDKEFNYLSNNYKVNKDGMIDDNYRQLACAVLVKARQDYLNKLSSSQRSVRENAIFSFLNISDLWFYASGFDKEIYYKKILGEDLYNNVKERNLL